MIVSRETKLLTIERIKSIIIVSTGLTGLMEGIKNGTD